MRQPGSIVHLKRIIRKAIYKLKWLYGFPADIYRESQGVYDPKTGRTPIERTKLHINRMIVFPGLSHRDIFFSITYIKANSNFIVGGDLELDDRQFLIDARDIPRDFDLKTTDYIVWDHKQFTIKSLFALEADTGYIVMARRPEIQHVDEIFDNLLKNVDIEVSEFTQVP